MPYMPMSHDSDPKVQIHEALGDLDMVELFQNQIVIAIYKRPEKTKSGIILTDSYRDEDRYQSKVGLIIKMGPDACVDPTGTWFKDVKFELDDWVVFRPSDGWPININGVDCRVLKDEYVKMRIPYPDMVW